ncbi:hypothetical protein CBL_21312, partial [Carabus blaptoides fortunei]
MKKGTNSKEIICQLDTGASCNVISSQTLQKVTGEKNARLKPSQVELKCFGGEILKPKGEVNIECEYKGRKRKLLFQVVETNRKPIIGCNSCEKLGLVQIKADLLAINERKLINKDYILKEYKDVFNGLGCIQEEHKLVIEENSVPSYKKGWPEKKEQVPVEIREYWHYRDELSVNNGMIFKGQNIIIPRAMRKEALNKIHSSHLGIEACLRKARDIIFWPYMSSEIRDKVAKCAYCNETRNKQINQPMLTHPIPTGPWQRVAMDLFEYKAQQWIVLTDCYSDYWETKKLK